MTANDAQVAHVMWYYAAYAAERLGMVLREEVDNLLEGQLVLVATPNGMNVGHVSVKFEEDEESRSESYSLNGQLLYEHHFTKPETWSAHPKLISHLPEKVAVYVAY